ncbi:PspC domain-containing protein [Pseudolysinimonas kribbensis]|uniref:PspC domain-containing protein n=1 Tax=Pseudolysinimonas kribbensis TaxID=433641 RepID=UPI0031D8867B
MASKSVPPPAEPEAEETASGEAPRDPRFFAWIRTLGLVRRTGWLGGVCAAIADRTRLDPILVRGIVVVLAVLGAPIVLLYAAAWFLLPDEKGAIHALTLARGRVESAVVAIAGLTLLSFLPLTQGFWWAGAAYWGEPDFGASAGRILWTLLVIAVGIVVIVWLARRAEHPDIRSVPATTDDKPETVPGAPPAEFAGPSTPPAEGDAELAGWRVQQEQWRHQRAAWSAQQSADDRARRAAEQAARAQEREARLAARRRREPFVGGAVIGLVFGLAVVAGCAVGLTAAVLHPDRAVGWTAGLGTAVVVFGLALAVAGVFRRRAGGLAALAVLALVGAALTAPLVVNRTLVPFVGYYGIDTTHGGRYARVFGPTDLIVGEAHRPAGTTIDLWQRTGDVRVDIAPGETVRVVASVAAGDVRRVTWKLGRPTDVHRVAPGSRRDGIARYDVTYGAGDPDVVIRISLESGSIAFGANPDLDGSAENRGTSTSAPTPTPSSPATEGARP